MSGSSKKAALYARVSTQSQSDNGTSLDTQLAACRKYAEQQGYSVVLEIQEDISGAVLARPGLDRIRDLAEHGAIDALIFYHVDRLSRDDTNTLILAREFRQRNVELDCATVRLEDTPTGKFLFSVLASVASLERGMIVERTRRGKLQKAREGRVLGGGFIAYGYTFIKGEGRLEPYEPEAYWVREAYRLVVEERLTVGKVRERLVAEGVPTKKGAPSWSHATILSMLRNRTYCGTFTYNTRARRTRALRPQSEHITVPVPPLVPVELWQEAQAVLDMQKAMQPRNTRHEYLLTGHIRCGLCGLRMKAHSSSQRRTKRYRYYVCPTTDIPEVRERHGGACAIRALDVYRADTEVWGEVVRQLTGEVALLQGMDHARQIRKEREHDDKELERIAQKLEKLEPEGERLLDLYQAGAIDLNTFVTRMDAIKVRRAALLEEQSSVHTRALSRQEDAPPDIDWQAVAREYRGHIDFFTFGEKREFLQVHNIRVILTPKLLTVFGLPLVGEIEL